MKTQLITPRSGNRHDFLKLARQLDAKAEYIVDNYGPSDHNLQVHINLCNRAEFIRKMVASWK